MTEIPRKPYTKPLQSTRRLPSQTGKKENLFAGKKKGIEKTFEKLTISQDADEDDVTCPQCGMTFLDDDGGEMWICCNNCDRWFDLKCTSLRSHSKEDMPDCYFCSSCSSALS